jgi:transcriptional regulator with XRE-family HTH domain
MSPNNRGHGLDTSQLMAQAGANLRAARKRAGVSQEAVAKGAGIHRTEVGLLERGERMPRLDTILKLAGALGIKPAEFFEGLAWVPDRREDGGQFVATGKPK